MTLKELYRIIEGNYEEMLGRFRKEERIEKFVLLFLNDQSYSQCIEELERGELERAFRAVHTLKGVSLNLGFEQMFRISDHLTEALRISDVIQAKQLLPEFRECYEKHVQAISTYRDSQKRVEESSL